VPLPVRDEVFLMNTLTDAQFVRKTSSRTGSGTHTLKMEACMLSPNANRETKLLRDFGEDQFLFTKRSSRRDKEGCNACSTGGG